MPKLSRGSVGDAVKVVQYALKLVGHLPPDHVITATFGPATEAAVMKWENAFKAPYPTGIVNDGTYAAMSELVRKFDAQFLTTYTVAAPKPAAPAPAVALSGYAEPVVTTTKTGFTLDKFKTALPGCKKPEAWLPHITALTLIAPLNKPEEIAMFLAQCGHESGDFNVLIENLSYSAAGLRKTFPKYFPDDKTAEAYAKKGEKIANKVYGGRLGNGPEASGDGWRFRGRGLIQLTGRDNYAACSQALCGNDMLVNNPDMLTDPKIAVDAAVWFWMKNKIAGLDVTAATKKINGGTHGLDDRKARYERALAVLV